MPFKIKSLSKQEEEKHCSGCWIYDKRFEYARVLDGVWSYSICKTGCWKEEERKIEYQSIYSKNPERIAYMREYARKRYAQKKVEKKCQPSMIL